MSDYGCFTTMRVEADGVRGLALHLRRLADDSMVLFERPMPTDLVQTVLAEALEGAQFPVVARVEVSAADFDRARPGGEHLRLAVSLRDAPACASGGLAPLRLLPVVHSRSLPEVKHVAMTPELVVRRRAQAAGFDDALFIGADGRVSEGPTWAIGFIADGGLVLPQAPALPSLTMRLIAGVVKTVERPVEVDAISSYDACFVASAVSGVRKVAAIGDVTFGLSNVVVDEISERYSELPRTPIGG